VVVGEHDAVGALLEYGAELFLVRAALEVRALDLVEQSQRFFGFDAAALGQEKLVRLVAEDDRDELDIACTANIGGACAAA
jgi:hypothetical protein